MPSQNVSRKIPTRIANTVLTRKGTSGASLYTKGTNIVCAANFFELTKHGHKRNGNEHVDPGRHVWCHPTPPGATSIPVLDSSSIWGGGGWNADLGRNWPDNSDLTFPDPLVHAASAGDSSDQ